MSKTEPKPINLPEGEEIFEGGADEFSGGKGDDDDE